MRHAVIALAAALGGLAGGATALLAQADAQAGITFRARLSPVPLTAAQTSSITGAGSVTATLAGGTVTVSGTFSGLQTPATAARLHAGERTGIRGPAFADLMVSAARSGSVGGAVPLTPAQVQDLRRGRVYVQLHSEKAPDGNLWGWLLAETRK